MGAGREAHLLLLTEVQGAPEASRAPAIALRVLFTWLSAVCDEESHRSLAWADLEDSQAARVPALGWMSRGARRGMSATPSRGTVTVDAPTNKLVSCAEGVGVGGCVVVALQACRRLLRLVA